jgi:hypothetical protein
MDTDKDPILTPRDMCEDAKISMATWRRTYRDKLEIVRVSPRRIGARRSKWLSALQENTETPAA